MNARDPRFRGDDRHTNPGHYILSGEINSGKSSKLFDYLKIWSQDGVNVSGFLSLPVIQDVPVIQDGVKKVSLPVIQDGVKLGYDLAIVAKSKITKKIKLIRDSEFKGGTKWRRFWLNDSAFQEAYKANFGTCNIFIIDEVGPLELEEHKGFWPILSNIYDTHKTTITVVRDSCLEQFNKTFPHQYCNML